MSNLTSSRSDFSQPSHRQRLKLHLIVRPGDHVLNELSRTLQRFTDDTRNLLGIVGDDMRLSINLADIEPHHAEQLARTLIRHDFVLKLSGQIFDHQGQEIYAINLYAS